MATRTITVGLPAGVLTASSIGTGAGTVAAGDDIRITGAVQGDGITNAVLLTQEEYDALPIRDRSTLYVLVASTP